MLCNYIHQEVVRERQENLRLVRLMQDKEEMIGKLKEEIDLLNRVSILHILILKIPIFWQLYEIHKYGKVV
jgi:hypothetical protein